MLSGRSSIRLVPDTRSAIPSPSDDAGSSLMMRWLIASRAKPMPPGVNVSAETVSRCRPLLGPLLETTSSPLLIAFPANPISTRFFPSITTRRSA